MDIWDLSKLLDLISLELQAEETCVAPNQQSYSMDGRSKIVGDLFTGSSLHMVLNSGSSCGSSTVKLVFCKGFHWFDKCQVFFERNEVFFVCEC